MGLIKNALNAVGNTAKGAAGTAGGALLGGLGGVLNQGMFQEYFVSGSMANDVIMKRAELVKSNGSTNNKSDANVISDGSIIDVQEQQCMIIVENGKVVEACMEAGRYTYRTDLAPSFFAGEGTFGERFKKSALEVWEQAKLGGQRRNTQRVYFLNMGILDKQINWGVGNIQFTHTTLIPTFGGQRPMQLRVKMKGHGTAKVQLKLPLEFFVNYGAKYAGGDNTAVVTIDSLDKFFTSTKNHISEAIAMAMADFSRNNPCAYNEVSNFDNMSKVKDLVNKQLVDTDLFKLGFSFYEFVVNGGFQIDEKDEERVQELEERAITAADPMMAQYDVQKDIALGMKASGESGAEMHYGQVMMGNAGFGQIGQTMGAMGGMQVAPGVVPFGSPNPLMNQQAQQPVQQPTPTAEPVVAAPIIDMGDTPEDSWTCECGHQNTGKFCMECGAKKPEPKPPVADGVWTCACGTQNTGKFCMECGSKRPEPKKMLVCDKCGWTAPAGVEKVKFCPECGDAVNEADYQ